MRIHRITFAALILGISAVSLGIAAMSYNQTPNTYASLSLHSGYSADGSTGGLEARSIQINLERTDQGWGGWMMLDPNHQNYTEFGQLTETTLMAGERIDITLTMVGKDEATSRTCYLVNQDRFDRKMYLVFPQNNAGTYRLVIRGNGYSATSVVFMEEEGAETMIARSE